MRVTNKELRRRIRMILSESSKVLLNEGPTPSKNMIFSNANMNTIIVSNEPLSATSLEASLVSKANSVLKNIVKGSSQKISDIASKKTDLTNITGQRVIPIKDDTNLVPNDGFVGQLQTLKTYKFSDTEEAQNILNLVRKGQDQRTNVMGDFYEDVFGAVIVPNHTSLTGEVQQLNSVAPNAPGVDLYVGDDFRNVQYTLMVAANDPSKTQITIPGVFYSIKSSGADAGMAMKAEYSGMAQIIGITLGKGISQMGTYGDWMAALEEEFQLTQDPRDISIKFKYGVGYGATVFKAIPPSTLPKLGLDREPMSRSTDFVLANQADINANLLDKKLFKFSITKYSYVKILQELYSSYTSLGQLISNPSSSTNNYLPGDLSYNDFNNPAVLANEYDKISTEISNAINSSTTHVVPFAVYLSSSNPSEFQSLSDAAKAIISTGSTNQIAFAKNVKSASGLSQNLTNMTQRALQGLFSTAFSEVLTAVKNIIKRESVQYITSNIDTLLKDTASPGTGVQNPEIVIQTTQLPTQMNVYTELIGIDLKSPLMAACSLFTPENENIEISYDANSKEWFIKVGNGSVTKLRDEWASGNAGTTSYAVAKNLGGEMKEVATIAMAKGLGTDQFINDLTSTNDRLNNVRDDFKNLVINGTKKNSTYIVNKLKPVLSVQRSDQGHAIIPQNTTQTSQTPQTIEEYLTIIRKEVEKIEQNINNAARSSNSQQLADAQKVTIIAKGIKELALQDMYNKEFGLKQFLSKMFPNKIARKKGKIRELLQYFIAGKPNTVRIVLNHAIDTLIGEINDVFNSIKNDETKKQILRTHVLAIRTYLSNNLTSSAYNNFNTKLTSIKGLINEVRHLIKTLIREILSQESETNLNNFPAENFQFISDVPNFIDLFHVLIALESLSIVFKDIDNTLMSGTDFIKAVNNTSY